MEDRQQLSRRLGLRLVPCAAGALAALSFGARAEPAPEAPPGEAPAPAVTEDAGATGAEGAAPPAPATPAVDFARLHREAAESFYATDGDRDGFVVALEAMEMPPERFAAADRDRDGKLTLVEWVDARFEGAGIGAPTPAP